MLLRHVQGLRDHPALGRAVIVLIIEANMSYIGADQVARLLQRTELRPIYVVSRDPSHKARPGVWTGENEKQLYALELERVLANNSLRRLQTLVHRDPAHANQKWEQLVRQIGMFRRTVQNPLDEVFQKFRVAFSGKGGGNADDLVLALQMALHWGSDVRRDPQFRAAAETQGWDL